MKIKMKINFKSIPPTFGVNIIIQKLNGLLLFFLVSLRWVAAKVYYSPRMDCTILPGGSCPDDSVLK
jgi:hypothetical protein